jgi:protein nanos 1
MKEFRLNGKDSEYCPESLPNDKYFAQSSVSYSDAVHAATATRSTKRTKKQFRECVFCKNNGEMESYYKQHILKDSVGRTVCPVLRAYTCPICKATGDGAHTIKYCPQNTAPLPVALINTLKARRTSTGHKRNKRISLSGSEIHID